VTEIVSDCTVDIRGKQYMLVPDEPAFGRQYIPRAQRTGLRHRMRVRAVRRGNQVEILGEAVSSSPPTQKSESPAASLAPQPGQAQQGQKNPGSQPSAGYFANPYNFVPFSTGPRALDGLKEEKPVGHDRWHEGRYCAKLRIRFTVKTPLLSVELARKEEGKPAVYSVRRDADGKPIVSGASIKGMLRATYEQATGSRLGVFKHDGAQSTRASSGDAPKLRFAKVVSHEPGRNLLTLSVQSPLLPTGPGVAVAEPLWSFAVPLRLLKPLAPTFGDVVHAWVQLLNHNERKVDNRGRVTWVRYHFWQVVSIDRAATPPPTPGPLGPWDKAVAGQGLVLLQGTLHNTGRTFPKKNAERFFADKVITGAATLRNSPYTVPRDQYPDVVARWRDKLDSFEQDRRPRADYIARKQVWAALPKDQTLYLRDKGTMPEFYPALISREVFPNTPATLLPPPLKPAAGLADLTAADRVFGWVAGDQGTPETTHRALLRVGGVVVTPTGNPPKPGKTTWELASLNSPKPANARFYTRDAKGDPLHGWAKGDGYQSDHVLAGHKVYPHHLREDAYWAFPRDGWPSATAPDKTPHREVSGHYQNFLAPTGSKPDVSIAIRDWIEPGTQLQTTLYVENVNRDELAALLWVITLGDGQDARHHRLGMGKPLGFGSLTAEIDWERSVLFDQAAIKVRYDAGDSSDQEEADTRQTTAHTASAEVARGLIEEFDRTFRQHSPATYLSLLAAACGTDLPVHYPRLGTGPGEVAPQAESYQWFVANDRPTGRKHALPLLTPSTTVPVEVLPTDPTKETRKRRT